MTDEHTPDTGGHQMLRLFGMNSPNVLKVVLMLEECRLTYELRHVAVFRQEQYRDWFVAMNPLAKVPVLVDPQLGQPLFESGAILHWLAEREGCFLPAEQPARAEVMQWLMVQMANIGPMLGQVNHFQLLPHGTQSYAMGRYHAVAERLYGILNDRLADRQWLAGDEYSIADMATQPWACYLERHGFAPYAYPHLLRWREAIEGRPATQAALARMETDFSKMAQATRKAATDADLDRFFGRADGMPDADYSIVRKM